MALNDEYFDSINIDVVRKKYYNANKVEAVFRDIRQQAAALTAENEAMRAELEKLQGTKMEIGEAIISARNIYQGLIEKANAEAEAIVSEAKQRSRQILNKAYQQQDYTVHQAEALYSSMRRQYTEGLEQLNSGWQQFLCGLAADSDEIEADEQDEEAAKHAESLSRIAAAMREIEED